MIYLSLWIQHASATYGRTPASTALTHSVEQ